MWQNTHWKVYLLYNFALKNLEIEEHDFTFIAPIKPVEYIYQKKKKCKQKKSQENGKKGSELRKMCISMENQYTAVLSIK